MTDRPTSDDLVRSREERLRDLLRRYREAHPNDDPDQPHHPAWNN